MAKPFLSIIIPNYPKTEELPLTLIDVDRHLSKQEYSYEIIVVNGKEYEKVGELIKNIKFIESGEGGIGALVRQGMLTAKGNWRVILDPKNSVPVSEFNKILSHLSDDYEIFAGVWGNDKTQWLPLFLTKRKFYCFSEPAANQIFAISKTNKYVFFYETLTIAKKVLKYRIKKIPVEYHKKTKTSFDLKAVANNIWEIIKIYWRLIRKKYAIPNL